MVYLVASSFVAEPTQLRALFLNRNEAICDIPVRALQCSYVCATLSARYPMAISSPKGDYIAVYRTLKTSTSKHHYE